MCKIILYGLLSLCRRREWAVRPTFYGIKQWPKVKTIYLNTSTVCWPLHHYDPLQFWLISSEHRGGCGDSRALPHCIIVVDDQQVIINPNRSHVELCKIFRIWCNILNAGSIGLCNIDRDPNKKRGKQKTIDEGSSSSIVPFWGQLEAQDALGALEAPLLRLTFYTTPVS